MSKPLNMPNVARIDSKLASITGLKRPLWWLSGLVVLLSLVSGSLFLFQSAEPEDIALTQQIKPDFTQFEAGPERKQVFFDYLLPLVSQHNSHIAEIRQELTRLAENRNDLSAKDVKQLELIAADYGMDAFTVNDEEQWSTLLRRVDIIPASLALAQAANESGWGTSNIAIEGNNFYGHWCFDAGCGMVPRARDAGASHELAVFQSVQESVEKYIYNLNKHQAYLPLRAIREELRDTGATLTGLELAEGLISYSERGEEYIEDIQQMIRVNKLSQFDD